MAGLLKSQLEDTGIKADVWDAAVSTIISLSLQAKVAVATSDIERARPIVEQFVHQQSEDGSKE